MTYEKMCIYIFQKEGFPDWEAVRKTTSRKANVRTARQICMYLGSIFFPSMSLAKLGDLFEKDHATVMHAKKTIINDIATRSDFSVKVKTYIHYFRRIIVNDETNEMLQQLKDQEIFDKIMDVIDKMEVVARVYCQLTNNQIIAAK